MLTIITLLLREKRFDFEHEEISIRMVQTPSGLSARISLRGAAAWGFNNYMGDFDDTLAEVIQKVLTYNVKGRKDLLNYYANGFHLLQRKGLRFTK